MGQLKDMLNLFKEALLINHHKNKYEVTDKTNRIANTLNLQ